MNHGNKIFRDAVDMIMNGSYFPSGRKNIICTAVGDTAAGNSILPYRKDPLVTLVCLSVRNLDLTKRSLKGLDFGLDFGLDIINRS